MNQDKDALINNIECARKEYQARTLNEQELTKDPFEQFEIWFNEAAATPAVVEPNAMALATVDAHGHPRVRYVLMKGFDKQGLRFFTNYNSDKGTELHSKPYAAVVFYWHLFERQVRIEGAVERISAEESERYFRSRPKEAQYGAVASRQSHVLPDRAELLAEVDRLKEKYQKTEVPLPAYWGGYILKPVRFEFWQGRVSRLHDRFVFEQNENGSWHVQRLYP